MSITVLATGFPTDFFSLDGEGSADAMPAKPLVPSPRVVTANPRRQGAPLLVTDESDRGMKEADKVERKSGGIRGFFKRLIE